MVKTDDTGKKADEIVERRKETVAMNPDQENEEDEGYKRNIEDMPTMM